MDAITIENRIVVTGGHLKSPVVLAPGHVQNVGDITFINLKKSDQLVCRLLAGECVSGTRQLTNTDIVEKLVDRRNKAYNMVAEQSETGGKEDLGLDEPATKKRRTTVEAMPLTIDIDAPSCSMHVLHRMKILLSKPGSSLWVELTAENVQYLRDFVAEQRSEANAPQKEALPKLDDGRIRSDVKGVSFSYTHTSWRASAKQDGKVVTKYLRINDADMDERLLEASHWRSNIESGGAPIQDM
jgi:hypothetical protein